MNNPPLTVGNPPAIRRVRHETKFRRLTVKHFEQLTPRMVRVSVAGDELAGFTSLGFDDHVKLMFPTPEGELRLPAIGANGPGPSQSGPQVDPKHDARPTMRDYTPRRYDPAKGQLLFDFVIHGEGPATTWAASAAPGQLLGVGGPRGSFIIPTELDWHLLVGDESALPAIGRRLEELPANTRALVIAEVDSEAEKLALRSAAKLDVVWVYRHGKGSGSPEPLVQALREAHFPSGQYFAWAAAESHVARAVRRYLIDERGVDRHWIKAAGYWQRGAAGAHDKIED